MKNVILSVLAVATLTAQAAVQSETTPYDNFKTQLELKPGQTYLSMMVNEVKPALDAFQADIDKEAKKNPRQFKKWQTDLIDQGAGVAIRIDNKNYFFNVGYADGSHGADDLKSGRSYGVGPTNRQSDPSDIAYLTELEDYLTKEPDSAPAFYEAIMNVILNCDASGWSGLSKKGQIVATDFLAIYTAELDRHMMIDLKPGSHPWEIDLAAATFDAAFVVASGKMVKDGELADGSVKEFWDKGSVGSGIGETRRDRKALQKMIAATLSKTTKGKNAIAQVNKIIDGDSDDIVQSALEFLNSPEQSEKSRMSANDRAALTEALLAYVDSMAAQADKVVAAQK